MENLFAWLPSVEEVLNSEPVKRCTAIEKPVQTQAAREVLANYRLQIKDHPADVLQKYPEKSLLKQYLYEEAAAMAKKLAEPLLHPVINGTGIVLHTNLGRAPLAKPAQQQVQAVISGYCNLEIDMESGNRSLRYQNVEALICELTGAEACLVVNNNAAAVLLALETMAKGKEAIISRGQLVEIGGSFRVPEVMEKSGVILREIGTTNKTRLSDYEATITEATGLLLLVHPSNFYMGGFVETPSLEELANLGQERQIPTLYDWGCGAIFPLAEQNIGHEQPLRKIVATGLDVITFSGDKLFGGPQCGILIGKKEWIQQMQKNPLTRAFRVDKMVLAALEGTLRCYSNQVIAREQIPIIHQLTKPIEELETLAQELQTKLQQIYPTWEITVQPGQGEVGGGSLPDVLLPTYLLNIRPDHGSLESLAQRLRTGKPAVLGYLKNNSYCLDVRTLLPGEEKQLLTAFQNLAESYQRSKSS